ncbi:energy-coupling factor transporter transmembrane protein EcfT [Brevibacterium sp. 91QC2O2]|jgi:energy-coupling factor transport system permease protein|uniref:energy-coupling factor transporter transmembrane component T family protein n=1 Tax=Brevibacterium TaxID=1696 RepID=UPI00211B9CF3|nr:MULTISPECIES: energy-coupling factor transporter transmembrane component T [unclassified Brevibacterium]MCQ9368207.1 energy-coupling factor transporter transmembrane protein EcfT [Brevibacterium sp. 91QC2O2]MCQ9385546.1 energy-coupling factor transporter transmembrane protein EcfT [Brevibacterium sp. 68QC2CO]
MTSAPETDTVRTSAADFAPAAGWVMRINPVAKIAVMALLTLGVILSIDVASASTMFVLQLIALPLIRLRWKLLSRLWFLPLTALLAGWGTAILAAKTGTVLVDLGPLTITSYSASMGLAIFLRAMCMMLPCVVLVLTIDSTELADALVQLWHLPERVVLAALAASRLLGLFAAELDTLRMARRARGAAFTGPLAKVAEFFPLAFALLVQALRRSGKLAMAMEGRAFGTAQRTWSRKSRLVGADWLFMTVAFLMAVLSIATAFWAGTWNPIV